MITIRTRDDKTFRVDPSEIMLSVLIRTIMEGVDENADVEIPLPNVDGFMLERIIEYTRHHMDDPMKTIDRPLPNLEFNMIISPWYHDFITSFEGMEGLYALIKAANYMDIPPLQDLACARVAYLIRGKEPDEIRKILGLDSLNP